MFSYSGNDLYCEQVPLADLAARAGTPAYVYSSQSILANYRAYDDALDDLPHSVCYAVKANSSLAALALLARAGAGAGFDIVSGGERVLLDSPALSSLPGHVPTHEDRAFSDSKAAASGPTSAIIWTAESTPKPALPPLVAPRPDAPGVASRPPLPIAPSALPS
jgi:hypothetical protein